VYDDDSAHPTRKALLQAAIKSMRQSGDLPSFSEIATAARVPRRTAYRYFTTVEELATAATLELLRPEMNRLISAGFTSADPAARMESVVAKMVDFAIENELVFRAMIRLTIGKPTVRGASRLAWFRTALEPLKESFDEEQFERLIRASAMALGIEAFIVFKEMCGADRAETKALATWIARTLVRQAIADAGEPNARRPKPAPPSRSRRVPGRETRKSLQPDI
jgi:AcrR family transcriptional regulator